MREPKNHTVATSPDSGYGFCDPTPVRLHLESLLDVGYSLSDIAEVCLLTPATLSRLLDGSTARVRASTASAILDVAPGDPRLPEPNPWVSPVRARRLVKALRERGLSEREIAERARLPYPLPLDGGRVRSSVVEALGELYAYVTAPRVALSDRVADVLETYFGEWFTIADLADRLGAKPASVARALSRRLPDHIVREVDPDTGDWRFRALGRSYFDELEDLAVS